MKVQLFLDVEVYNTSTSIQNKMSVLEVDKAQKRYIKITSLK